MSPAIGSVIRRPRATAGLKKAQRAFANAEKNLD
jgi:hypothetical protein